MQTRGQDSLVDGADSKETQTDGKRRTQGDTIGGVRFKSGINAIPSACLGRVLLPRV